MCARPCKLFPDVFMLLALKIEGMALLFFFNFLCHFLSLSRYCSFNLFEKRMKCKISLKKKALQTPRKWTIFAGHCDILWSAVFSSFLIFFADLFVMWLFSHLLYFKRNVQLPCSTGNKMHKWFWTSCLVLHLLHGMNIPALFPVVQVWVTWDQNALRSPRKSAPGTFCRQQERNNEWLYSALLT